MDAVEIKGDDYSVTYDPVASRMTFEGILRLPDYSPIKQVLDGIVALSPEEVSLDLRGLKFLNSLGIYTLLGFVIKVRDQATSRIVVYGSAGFPWQGRSLKDLKRLMPELRLEWA